MTPRGAKVPEDAWLDVDPEREALDLDAERQFGTAAPAMCEHDWHRPIVCRKCGLALHDTEGTV